MTKKEIGRCIAFVLVVCLLLLTLCEIFELSDSTNIAKRFQTFEDLNENTLDAVWVGTSGVDRYWISTLGYAEYGMTIYPFSSDAMPTWLFIDAIEASLRNHDPELFIIDVRAYGQSNDDVSTMDVRARRVLDGLDFFSIDRFKMAFSAMEAIQKVSGEKDAFDLSLLLSYIKYHSKWEEDNYSVKSNFQKLKHAYMGFYMNIEMSVYAEPMEIPPYDSDYYEPLDPIAEADLYELLDYAEEHGIKLLFVDTPQKKGPTELGRGNTVFRILEERGVDYINFCETDAAGNNLLCPDLDPARDFYNEGHVNYRGADKFTRVMAAYLDEHYDFPDRRQDAAAAQQWDGLYEAGVQKVVEWGIFN